MNASNRLVYLWVVLCLSIMGCDSAEEPTFQKMANIRVTDIQKGVVTLTADAIYHNPNPIGGELTATDIAVIVNDVEVAQIKQELSTDLEANSDFTIPVVASFPLNEVVKKEGDVISGLVSAILKKKVQVTYQGNTRVRIAGFGFEVPVDYEQEVSLKK